VATAKDSDLYVAVVDNPVETAGLLKLDGFCLKTHLYVKLVKQVNGIDLDPQRLQMI
jgi:hypothetical protein